MLLQLGALNAFISDVMRCKLPELSSSSSSLLEEVSGAMNIWPDLRPRD